MPGKAPSIQLNQGHSGATGERATLTRSANSTPSATALRWRPTSPRRDGETVLLVNFNDGAFGSEIHMLRADGSDNSGAIFGRTDLAAVARGFGPLFETNRAQDVAEV